MTLRLRKRLAVLQHCVLVAALRVERFLAEGLWSYCRRRTWVVAVCAEHLESWDALPVRMAANRAVHATRRPAGHSVRRLYSGHDAWLREQGGGRQPKCMGGAPCAPLAGAGPRVESLPEASVAHGTPLLEDIKTVLRRRLLPRGGQFCLRRTAEAARRVVGLWRNGLCAIWISLSDSHSAEVALETKTDRPSDLSPEAGST